MKYSRKIPTITLDNKIPWLTYLAIDWLEKNLRKEMVVFEWGSGGSTLFFAKRADRVVSIEHDELWHTNMMKILENEKASNCECLLVMKSGKGVEAVDDAVIFKDYYQAISKYPDNHFDIVVIDGKARNECAEASKYKVKSGGIIIFDNSERKLYKTGLDIFKDWHKKEFYGPGPYNHYFSKTTIFTKPIN